jgi:hypothetical protein
MREAIEVDLQRMEATRLQLTVLTTLGTALAVISIRMPCEANTVLLLEIGFDKTDCTCYDLSRSTVVIKDIECMLSMSVVDKV